MGRDVDGGERAMYASLLVTTHPESRALAALRGARRVAREAGRDPGVAFARAAQTGVFPSDFTLPFVRGRVALMVWSSSREVLDGIDARLSGPLSLTATERWRLVLEPVRVHGDWAGFSPGTDGVPPLRTEEPVVVMISGVLKARYFLRFARDNVRVGEQLGTAAGYLGGLGMADTPLTTTSLSCWSSSRASRAFAFGAGAHRSAYKIDQAESRHATEFFVRFRPLHSEGTFEGRNPFGDVLAGPSPRARQPS